MQRFLDSLSAFAEGGGGSLVDLSAGAHRALRALLLDSAEPPATEAGFHWWEALVHADCRGIADRFSATDDVSRRLDAFSEIVLQRCSALSPPCAGPAQLAAVSALAGSNGKRDADIGGTLALPGAHSYDALIHKAPTADVAQMLLFGDTASLSAISGPAGVGERLQHPRSGCAGAFAVQFAEVERVFLLSDDTVTQRKLGRFFSRVFWTCDPTTDDDVVCLSSSRNFSGEWMVIQAGSQRVSGEGSCISPLTASTFDMSDPGDLRTFIAILLIRHIVCDILPLRGLRGETSVARRVCEFVADLVTPIMHIERDAGRVISIWLTCFLLRLEAGTWEDTRALLAICRAASRFLRLDGMVGVMELSQLCIDAAREAGDVSSLILLSPDLPESSSRPVDWRQLSRTLSEGLATVPASLLAPLSPVVERAKELCDVIDARLCVSAWQAAAPDSRPVEKVFDDLWKFALFPAVSETPSGNNNTLPGGRVKTTESGSFVERQHGDVDFVWKSRAVIQNIVGCMREQCPTLPYLQTLLELASDEFAGCCVREPQSSQRVFVCLSCSTHMAAICSSCALLCHAAYGHELVDIGFRRDIGCDCGSARLVSVCSIKGESAPATTEPLLFGSNFAIPPRICYERGEDEEIAGCSFNNAWREDLQIPGETGESWSSASQLQCISCQAICHVAPCTYDTAAEVKAALADPSNFVCNLCFDDELEARDEAGFVTEDSPPVREDGEVSAGKAEIQG